MKVSYLVFHFCMITIHFLLLTCLLLIQFLREQAALSASEITADSVNEFLADAEEDTKIEEVLDHSKGTQHTWEKILTNVMDMSSSKVVDEDLFRFKNGSVKVPKVNGKHNKHMQHVSLNTGIEFGKIMFANIPMYKEVLPSLESWLAGKVASWSNLEGNSVQWLCIVCIDRKGNNSPFQKLVITKLLSFSIA